MFRRRRRRGVPPLNTTSTADISFMLLIFFLVTTSMGADKAIKRELPPLNLKEQQATAVSPGAVLHVEVQPEGVVMIDGAEVAHGQLRETVRNFIQEHGSTHLLQLRSNREAAYDTYYFVQNEIQMAYRQLRDNRAREEYGHGYEQLTDAQRQSVDKAIPQRLAEDYDNSSPQGSSKESSSQESSSIGKVQEGKEDAQ